MSDEAQSQTMKPRVLVVEDEFFIAQEIADELAAANIEVLGPCPTVQKALALLDSNHCDAAILDVSLRNENSMAVVQALTDRGIPFIVLTGFSQAQLPQEIAGAPVLTKPLNAQALIRELQRILLAR
jgi:DNA-binding response OmpR family regulator